MTAAASQLTGAIPTDAASTSTVTLAGGTTWNMTGNSNVTNLTNNDSLIRFSGPAGDPTQLSSYKTLTAVNYTGTGGEILLNTYLGGDGSPSDRLIINGGTATGSNGLFIHNTTGQGAETTGNGILVVNALNGGTTIPGAFMLTGEARGGAFSYDLFRGGLGGSAPNDWFLRSSFMSRARGRGQAQWGQTFPLTRRRQRLPPGIYPIIGPDWRPMAWCNRSRGSWASRHSARCTSGSATR